MPNTYTQLMYHIVFSTKNRERTLPDAHRDDLYRYFWGIHNNLGCHLYRIGGMDDHVHILTGMPTTQSLADYVGTIKTGTTKWLKTQATFPRFEGWQDGYGGFSESFRDKDTLIEYIKGQAEHRRESFLDEYRRLLAEHGIEFDERYLA